MAEYDDLDPELQEAYQNIQADLAERGHELSGGEDVTIDEAHIDPKEVEATDLQGAFSQVHEETGLDLSSGKDVTMDQVEPPEKQNDEMEL